MDQKRWNAIVSRIAPHEVTDIDGTVAEIDDLPPTQPGCDIFPEVTAVLMPETRMKRPDAVCVGLRVTGELPDAADRAMRLAAFALERDVEVIVLSHVDASGLEPYGFRTERIAGDTDATRAACEEQVRRFWNIDLVL